MKPFPHVLHKIFNVFGRKSSSDDSALQSTGYVLGKKLGEGTYATVRLAWSTEFEDQEPLAVKIVERSKLSADFCNNFFCRELEILRQLDHENVIRVYNIIDVRKKVYIFMQNAEKGDLFNYLDTRGPLAEDLAANWFHQIVCGLQYCHHLSIAHRDLKTDNILITRANTVVISDFGLACCCSNPPSCCSPADPFSSSAHLSRTFCGSPAFAAPEILSCQPYNPMVSDIWSLGVLLYNMLTCRLPFDDSNLLLMLNHQQRRKWSFGPSVQLSQHVQQLLVRILEPSVAFRISLAGVLTCSWFEHAALDCGEDVVCSCLGPKQ